MASSEKVPAYSTLNFDPASLTDKEIGMLRVMRRLRFGTIENLAVAGGEPVSMRIVHERIDLSRTVDLNEVLEGERPMEQT